MLTSRLARARRAWWWIIAAFWTALAAAQYYLQQLRVPPVGTGGAFSVVLWTAPIIFASSELTCSRSAVA